MDSEITDMIVRIILPSLDWQKPKSWVVLVVILLIAWVFRPKKDK